MEVVRDDIRGRSPSPFVAAAAAAKGFFARHKFLHSFNDGKRRCFHCDGLLWM